jgi:pimeloyl-ACP methyl ester carboxylesterase
MKQALAAAGLAVTLAACGTTGAVSSKAQTSSKAQASSKAPATRVPANVRTAPTRIARTAAGTVGYREVGAGSPLLLITGFGASMDNWPPSFVPY